MQTYLEKLNGFVADYEAAEDYAKAELSKLESKKEFLDSNYYDKLRREILDNLEAKRGEVLKQIAAVGVDFDAKIDEWATLKGENVTADAQLLRDDDFKLSADELTQFAEKYKLCCTMSRLVHAQPALSANARALHIGAEPRKTQFAKVVDVYDKLIKNKKLDGGINPYKGLIEDEKFQGDIWLGHPALQDIEMLV